MGDKAFDGAQQVRRANTAIGPKGNWRIGDAIDQLHHLRRGHAHHRAARGVKAHGATPRRVHIGKGFGSGEEFFGGGNCLNPDNIGTAIHQALGGLFEHLNRRFVRERARFAHDLTGWANRPGNDDITIRCIRHFATQFRRQLGQLIGAVARIVQFQA